MKDKSNTFLDFIMTNNISFEDMIHEDTTKWNPLLRMWMKFMIH